MLWVGSHVSEGSDVDIVFDEEELGTQPRPKEARVLALTSEAMVALIEGLTAMGAGGLPLEGDLRALVVLRLNRASLLIREASHVLGLERPGTPPSALRVVSSTGGPPASEGPMCGDREKPAK